LPVIINLRNPNLKIRHWEKIEEVLGHQFVPEEVVSLQLLTSYGIFDHTEEITEISGQASSEAGLESLLNKVISLFILFYDSGVGTR
jgi:dynein heavy chain